MSILRETSFSCFLALSILSAAACGADDTPPVDSNEPNEPNEPEPVEPDPCLLRFDTEPLRWSAVGVGYEAAETIEFSNEGDELCLVTLAVTGDGFATEFASFAINPDATRTVPVTWEPTGVGPATGKLVVTSGDLEEEIALEGHAVEGCLSLSPEVVDFGETAPRCSTVEEEVVIENGCSHPVAIASFALESGELNTAQSVFGIRQSSYGPFVPGTESMTLVYRPLAVGEDSDVLTVVEENGAVATVGLRGTGRLDARQVDTFEQPMRPRIDVLFVVDDSPAMTPYAADLGPLGEDVAAYLRDERFVARVGVTTTSRTATDGCAGSGADGRLVPVDGSSPRWLETDSDLPLSAYADLLDVATCSEASNEGLASAVRAVTEPLASQTDDPMHPEVDDGNAGFLRDDAGLTVIFVSASDDTSGDTVEALHGQFLQNRQANSLQAVALVAPEGGCDAATAGTRYAELAGRTSGIVASICEEASWDAASLLPFGGHGFPYSSRFFLTSRPQDADGNGSLEGEITVEVDGEPVPATGDDGEVRWTYDSAANAIDFAPSHIPPEGSLTNVSYFSSCH